MRWNYRVRFMGYTPNQVKQVADSESSIAIYDGLVYDLTDCINFPPSVEAPSGFSSSGGVDTQYMSSSVVDRFKQNAGGDISNKLDSLNLDRDTLSRQKTCLRNLFLIGKQDNRNSLKCLFATYIVLALSIVMVCIIGFKFLAALRNAVWMDPVGLEVRIWSRRRVELQGWSPVRLDSSGPL